MLQQAPIVCQFASGTGVQCDLYSIPRGMERFRAYLRTMTDAETGDLELPLVAMNPMGKDHVPALLDRYLELGASAPARSSRGVRARPGSPIAAQRSPPSVDEAARHAVN